MAQSTAHIISSADGQVFTRAQVMSMMLVAEKIDTIEDTVFVACIGGTDANTFKPDMLIRTLRSTERITANEDKWMCERLLTTLNQVKSCNDIDIKAADDILFLWRKLVKSLAYRDQTYRTLVTHRMMRPRSHRMGVNFLPKKPGSHLLRSETLGTLLPTHLRSSRRLRRRRHSQAIPKLRPRSSQLLSAQCQSHTMRKMA